MLATQLLFVMQRALNVVRSDPTKLVTALRIIEREEKSVIFYGMLISLVDVYMNRSDTKALAKEKAVGFLPPGRPKEWKRKCLDALEKATTQRSVLATLHAERINIAIQPVLQRIIFQQT